MGILYTSNPIENIPELKIGGDKLLSPFQFYIYKFMNTLIKFSLTIRF